MCSIAASLPPALVQFEYEELARLQVSLSLWAYPRPRSSLLRWKTGLVPHPSQEAKAEEDAQEELFLIASTWLELLIPVLQLSRAAVRNTLQGRQNA